MGLSSNIDINSKDMSHKKDSLKNFAKTGVTKRLGFAPLGVTSIPTQVAIGVASASYWRGMWYILDDNLFPDNPLYSAVASLGLGSFGLAFGQGVIARKAEYYARKEAAKLPFYYTPIARFVTLYCVATSCVLVWRGGEMASVSSVKFVVLSFQNSAHFA